MLHRPTIHALICVALLSCHHARGGEPPVSIGYGYADTGSVTGLPDGEGFTLQGTIYFSSYWAPDNVMVPPGMHYMSYIQYERGEGNGMNCTSATGGVGLCNFTVVPGRPLVEALRNIPSNHVYGPASWIRTSSLGALCGGWVLSATRDAALGSYAIGSFTCGVRPEGTACLIDPASLDITMTVELGGTGRGLAHGSVACNRVVDVRLRTPAIPGSRLNLGASEGAPIAELSINGRPAWRGADIRVDGSAGFIVSANVERTDTAGEFSGSTALIIEYL